MCAYLMIFKNALMRVVRLVIFRGANCLKAARDAGKIVTLSGKDLRLSRILHLEHK